MDPSPSWSRCRSLTLQYKTHQMQPVLIVSISDKGHRALLFLHSDELLVCRLTAVVGVNISQVRLMIH